MRPDGRVIAGLIVVGTLAAATLLVGAVYPPTVLGLLASAFAAALLLLIDPRRGIRRANTDPVLLLLGVLVVATALQLLPLPPALLQLVSPAAATLWEEASGGARSWRPISIDPAATGIEVAKAVLYALFYASLIGLRARRVLRWLPAALLGLAVTVAAIGMLHQAGGSPILGIYTPRQYTPGQGGMFSTLVNSNHLAGFLSLTALLAIGRAVGATTRPAQAAYSAVALFLGTGLALTLSRGGITAFILGLIVFGVLTLARSRAGGSGQTALRGGAVVGLLLAAVLYVGAARVAGELHTLGAVARAPGGAQKIQVWREAAGLLERYPLAGSGRGTFELAFTQVRRLRENITVTHPENVALQLGTEMGVLVAAALLLLGLLAFARLAGRRGLSLTEVGALAGVAAVGLQNLADFSLELPGVVLPVLCCLSVVSVPIGARRRPPTYLRRRWTALALGLFAVLGLAGGALGFPHSFRADAERLRKMALAHGASVTKVLAVAREVQDRHPADYLPPLLAAGFCIDHRTCNPLTFLSRADHLFPQGGVVHLEIGRSLVGSGRWQQGLLELRLAAERAPWLGPTAGRVLAAAMDDPAPLVQRTSEGSHRDALFLDFTADAYLALGNLSAARALSLAVHQRFDRHAPALRRLVACSWELGRPDDAVQFAKRAVAAEGSPEDFSLLARAHLRLQDREAARRALADGLARHSDAPSLLRVLARSAVEEGSASEARDALRRWGAVAGDSADQLAEIQELLGRLEEASGRSGQAMRHYERAREYAPQIARYAIDVARTAEAAGQLDRAIAAYRQLSESSADGRQQYAKKLRELEDRRHRSSIPRRLSP